MVQHKKNFHCHHMNIVARNGIASSVCVANTPVAKFFTNIVVFAIANTVCRWLGLWYFLIMLLIHLGFTVFAMEKDTIINSYNSIMSLYFVFNVVVNPNSSLNISMSSDVQHNDDCYFVVVKPNNGFNVINSSNNNQQTANSSIKDTTMFQSLYSMEVSNNNIQMIFELMSITYLANRIRLVNYDYIFIDNSHNYHLSHYNFIIFGVVSVSTIILEEFMFNITPCTMKIDLFTYDMKHLSFDSYFRIFSSCKTKNYIDYFNHCYCCKNMTGVNEILFINRKLDENSMRICIYIVEFIFEKIVMFNLHYCHV